MYAVTAEIILSLKGSGDSGTYSVPTFYLNEDVQGILDETQARKIADAIVNPFGDYECQITVVKL